MGRGDRRDGRLVLDHQDERLQNPSSFMRPGSPCNHRGPHLSMASGFARSNDNRGDASNALKDSTQTLALYISGSAARFSLRLWTTRCRRIFFGERSRCCGRTRSVTGLTSGDQSSLETHPWGFHPAPAGHLSTRDLSLKDLPALSTRRRCCSDTAGSGRSGLSSMSA